MSAGDDVLLDLLEERTGVRLEIHQLLTLACALSSPLRAQDRLESLLALPTLNQQIAEAHWLDAEWTACRATMRSAARIEAETGRAHFSGRVETIAAMLRRLESLGFRIGSAP